MQILRLKNNSIDYATAWRKLCFATLDSVDNGKSGKAQYIAKLSYPDLNRMDNREFSTIYYLGLKPMKLSEFVERIFVLQIQIGHTYTIRSIRNTSDESSDFLSDLTLILSAGPSEEHLYIRTSCDLPDITDLADATLDPVRSVKNARDIYSSASRLVINPDNKDFASAKDAVDQLAAKLEPNEEDNDNPEE